MSSEVENKTFGLISRIIVPVTDPKSIIVLFKLYLFFCLCLCASGYNVIRCIFDAGNIMCLAFELSEGTKCKLNLPYGQKGIF